MGGFAAPHGPAQGVAAKPARFAAKYRRWHTRRLIRQTGPHLMAMLAGDRGVAARPAERRLTIGMLALLVSAAAALAFVASALWPRWPEASVAADAPALPIVVGG